MAFLHHLLHQSAGVVQGKGQRLVLVVDGLDEDGSSAAGLSSIASMLPKHLDYGAKVIVSGRRNPGLPTDVPADHPLRRDEVVRTLSASQHAKNVKESAEGELQHQLRGPEVRRDVLGLLVAAKDGLTVGDLAELTGLVPYELDWISRTAIGRTFVSQPALSSTGAAETIFIIAHDELGKEAARALGPVRLKGYHDRLDEWADSYRARGWPPDTPANLLRGYPEMLRQQHDDQELMILAADGSRHDRMLAASGGDVDALAEIDAALAAAVTQQVPDLTLVARVAYQRDRLRDRNTQIPAELPVAWARLGQHSRAEALARSIVRTRPRVQALAGVGEVYAEAGLADAADRLLDEANVLADASSDPHERHWALGVVAGGLARAGHSARAEDMAIAIPDSYSQVRALASVAAGLARAGDYDRATAITASRPMPNSRQKHRNAACVKSGGCSAVSSCSA